MSLHISSASASWVEVSLPVEDVERSVRFYEDALGLQAVERGDDWAVLRDRKTGQRLRLQQDAPHGHPAITVRCSNFETALSFVEEAGATEGYSEESPTLKLATVHDPDGHEILLRWESDD